MRRGALWVGGLLPALICCAQSTSGAELQLLVRKISYEYTIEVRAGGPAAAKNPAKVELKWPNGTKTVTLSGALASETVTIDWEEPYPTDPKLAPKRVYFGLEVLVSREGFLPWRTRYACWDFVRVRDDLFRLLDKVTLHAPPPGVAEDQLTHLSLALPCELGLYTYRHFADFDKDGQPEAILSRGVQPSALNSPVAELQIWSLREGAWVQLFVANHRGVFVAGELVPGTGPAPNGYRYRGAGEPGPGDTPRTGEAHLCIVDLCRADRDGNLIREELKSYVWRKGQKGFVVLPRD
jgi:hypothetical protein